MSGRKIIQGLREAIDQAGGPAFPQLELVSGERDGHGDAIEAFTVATGGMTLRDWFAGQALSIVYMRFMSGADPDPEDLAIQTYLIADAMLAAREGGAA